jgi:hypothetical protein
MKKSAKRKSWKKATKLRVQPKDGDFGDFLHKIGPDILNEY